MDIQNIILPSNRKFGFFLSAMMLLISWIVYEGMITNAVIGLLILGFFFLCSAVFFPALLGPLNKFWMVLGIILGKIVSPIVMGILFFILITPVAIVIKISGRDELHLKKYDTASYWRIRHRKGPSSESFREQF